MAGPPRRLVGPLLGDRIMQHRSSLATAHHPIDLLDTTVVLGPAGVVDTGTPAAT